VVAVLVVAVTAEKNRPAFSLSSASSHIALSVVPHLSHTTSRS
jgi:hypothetical protein